MPRSFNWDPWDTQSKELSPGRGAAPGPPCFVNSPVERILQFLSQVWAFSMSLPAALHQGVPWVQKRAEEGRTSLCAAQGGCIVLCCSEEVRAQTLWHSFLLPTLTTYFHANRNWGSAECVSSWEPSPPSIPFLSIFMDRCLHKLLGEEGKYSHLKTLKAKYTSQYKLSEWVKW
jgi:hypothetical protein